MPIGERVLDKYGSPYILATGEQTLGDAIDELGKAEYATNAAYLVAVYDDTYHVALCAKLEDVVGLVGPKAFDIQLSDLPIPETQRVVPVSTPESSEQVLDWLANHPQSTIVITDEKGRVVGLFANPNRAGMVGPLLSNLHGRLVDICEDYRLDIPVDVEPPQCHACNHLNFFEFAPETKKYSCPHCGATVELL